MIGQRKFAQVISFHDENMKGRVLDIGAGIGEVIDVFKDEPYQGELQNFDYVIMTPHIGAYAIETRIAMEYEAVQNLLIGFDDE